MITTLRLVAASALLFLIALIGVVSTSAPVAAQAPASETYKSVYDGWKWWHVYCYRCHGVDAVGTDHDVGLDARAIAREAMQIAAAICLYTNDQIVVEELS